MKLDIKNKILVVLLFFLTCGSLNAFAQRKAAVGGQFSAWHNGKENSTTVFITPDIGYTLSSRWYLGTGIGYAFCDSKDTKVRRNRQTLWGGRTDANPKLSLNDT